MAADEGQIAAQVIMADDCNVVQSVSTLSSNFDNIGITAVRDPPLNNKDFLADMKEVNRSRDPGSVVYLEFDVKDYITPEYLAISGINEDFVQNSFSFSVNVRSELDGIGNCT